MATKTQLQDKVMEYELQLADLREDYRKAEEAARAAIQTKAERIKELIKDIQYDISFHDRIEKAKQNAKEVGNKRKGVKNYV